MPLLHRRAMMLAQAPPLPGLTVCGEARCAVVPDLLELSLGAETRGPTAAQALRENSLRLGQILNALTGAGIAAAHIRHTGLALTPIYNPIPPHTGNLPSHTIAGMMYAQPGVAEGGVALAIAGYCARSGVKVSLHEIARAADILDAAVKAGANFNIGLWWALQDEATVRRAALEMAGREAHAKAQALATVLGRQLGEPLTVLEEITPPWRPPLVPSGPPPDPCAISPSSELTVTARIQVTYALR